MQENTEYDSGRLEEAGPEIEEKRYYRGTKEMVNVKLSLLLGVTR